MLGIVILAVGLSVLLFIYIPKGFFPQQDTGRIVGSIIAEQDISFQLMQKKLEDYIKIITQDPSVAHAVGITGSTTTNAGNIYITLKPLNLRRYSADGVINHLRPKLAKIPGATLYLQAAQDLVIGGRLGNAQYQYTIFADSLLNLNAWASKVKAAIENTPGITDFNSDQLNNGLQTFMTYDRNTASRFGISAEHIDDTLNDAFGQRQVSVMYTLLNQYHVVMEVAPMFWQQPETLNHIYVTSSSGNAVPLTAIAVADNSATLLAVNHQNEFPSATYSFNLLPKISLGTVVNQITNKVSAIHLPPDVQAVFQGTAQAFQASLVDMPYLLIVALAAVYIVLGILYESLIHPITILSTLPSAGVGALLALLLTHVDLTIIAFIGIILLVGIVKKNAIMMIDFALDCQRNENMSSRDAIYRAAQLRLRPILMTTVAAMFGVLPLVIGFGVGSEMRRPLGITIIGGLMVSQLLTLYTTPAIFLALEKVRKFGNKIWVRNPLNSP